MAGNGVLIKRQIDTVEAGESGSTCIWIALWMHEPYVGKSRAAVPYCTCGGISRSTSVSRARAYILPPYRNNAKSPFTHSSAYGANTGGRGASAGLTCIWPYCRLITMVTGSHLLPGVIVMTCDWLPLCGFSLAACPQDDDVIMCGILQKMRHGDTHRQGKELNQSWRCWWWATGLDWLRDGRSKQPKGVSWSEAAYVVFLFGSDCDRSKWVL